MSKYRPLETFLRASTGRVELSFRDIEEILGFRLPRSARRHAAWWSNSGGTHVQSHAWTAAKYRTEKVALADERLVFEPERSQEGFSEMTQAKFKNQDAPQTKAKAGNAGDRHPAWGIWKGLVTLDPNYDYTQPADPEWGGVYEK